MKQIDLNLPLGIKSVNQESLVEFFELMYERQEIWWKRNVLNLPRPWSENPILANYKFTNIYRELDRASQFLIKNVILDSKSPLPDKILRGLIFRFFNQPNTFEKHGATLNNIFVDKNPIIQFNELLQQIAKIRNSGVNPWHTAYMMNLAFANKEFKTYSLEYKFKDWAYTNVLFVKVQEKIPGLMKVIETGTAHEIVQYMVKNFPGVSDFTATEFYLDFCLYAKYDKPIMKWDENTFANPGPGCQIGLLMIFPDLEKKKMVAMMEWMRDASSEFLGLSGDFKYIKWDYTLKKYIQSEPNLTTHQIEFWLCEYQKYVKMKEGFGKRRSKFTPHK